MKLEPQDIQERVQFEVEGSEPGGTVFIRWDTDIRTDHRVELEHLVYALLTLRGAEEVKLRRYSCMITLARHITDADELKLDVIAAINDIRGDLERAFGCPIVVLDFDAEIEATVAGVESHHPAFGGIIGPGDDDEEC